MSAPDQALHLYLGGKSMGPYSWRDIEQKIADGDATAETLASADLGEHWWPVRNFAPAAKRTGWRGRLLGPVVGVVVVLGAVAVFLLFGMASFMEQEQVRARLLGFGFQEAQIEMEVETVRSLGIILRCDLETATDIYISAVSGTVKPTGLFDFRKGGDETFTQWRLRLHADAVNRASKLEQASRNTLTGKFDRWWRDLKDGSAKLAQQTGVVWLAKKLL